MIHGDAFANGIFSAEILAGRRFIDDQYFGRAKAIRLGEHPPALERNAHRAEPVRGDPVHADHRIAGGTLRPVGKGHDRTITGGAERGTVGKCHVLHARNTANLRLELLVEPGHRIGSQHALRD